MRTTIPQATRKAVFQRDKERCRKCGGKTDIQMHHIQAVYDGGSNELDNLMLLCGLCHHEWHMVEGMKGITLETWLLLPNYQHFVRVFSDEKLWTDEVTAKQARDGLLQIAAIFRDGAVERE